MPRHCAGTETRQGKRRLRPAVMLLIVFLSTSAPLFATLPVLDFSNLANAIQSATTAYEFYTTQYQVIKDDYERYRKIYEGLSQGDLTQLTRLNDVCLGWSTQLLSDSSDQAKLVLQTLGSASTFITSGISSGGMTSSMMRDVLSDLKTTSAYYESIENAEKKYDEKMGQAKRQQEQAKENLTGANAESEIKRDASITSAVETSNALATSAELSEQASALDAASEKKISETTAAATYVQGVIGCTEAAGETAESLAAVTDQELSGAKAPDDDFYGGLLSGLE